MGPFLFYFFISFLFELLLKVWAHTGKITDKKPALTQFNCKMRRYACLLYGLVDSMEMEQRNSFLFVSLKIMRRQYTSKNNFKDSHKNFYANGKNPWYRQCFAVSRMISIVFHYFYILCRSLIDIQIVYKNVC